MWGAALPDDADFFGLRGAYLFNPRRCFFGRDSQVRYFIRQVDIFPFFIQALRFLPKGAEACCVGWDDTESWLVLQLLCWRTGLAWVEKIVDNCERYSRNQKDATRMDIDGTQNLLFAWGIFLKIKTSKHSVVIPILTLFFVNATSIQFTSQKMAEYWNTFFKH